MKKAFTFHVYVLADPVVHNQVYHMQLCRFINNGSFFIESIRMPEISYLESKNHQVNVLVRIIQYCYEELICDTSYLV